MDIQEAMLRRLAARYAMAGKREEHRDPSKWVKDILGEHFWSMQREIGLSVRDNRFTTVQACHASGKSHMASRLVAWWVAMNPPEDLFVVTTAPTAAQVSAILWRYINRVHNLARERGNPLPGQILSSPIPSWKINGELVGYGRKPADYQDSAFQGIHAEKVLVVVDEACYSADTDVLTRDGWKHWPDVTAADELLTLDPVTQRPRYTRPLNIIRKPYTGSMHTYAGKGLNFSVTPDHTMYYGQRQPWKGNGRYDWRTAQAQEITTWANKAILKVPNWEAPDNPDLDDGWLSFLGWFAAEGSIDKRLTTIRLTQNPGARQDEILALCTRLGMNPKRYGRDIAVHSSRLARHLAQWGRTQLVRRVPDPVRFASPRQIGVFLDAFSAGDGYHKGNGREILYTSSPRMADDLQELVLKTGVPSVIRPRALAGRASVMPDGHTATSSVDGYTVSRPVHGTGGLAFPRDTNQSMEDYDGTVYCAVMPRDHLLFVRRNGYTAWLGNCGVEKSIWDAVDSLVTNEDSRVLAIGNPTDPGTHFREICDPTSSKAEKWHKVRIDALRSPLMTEEACSRFPELAEYMQEEGVPFSTEEVPEALQKTLVSPIWVYEAMKSWGKDSSLFRAKVRGIFPEESSEGIIPLGWYEKAVQRWHAWDEAGRPSERTHGQLILGVDVADGGEDETVFAVRQGDVVTELHRRTTPDPLANAEAAEDVAAQNGQPTGAKFVVDGIGVGSGVVAQLRRDGQHTVAFIASAQSGRKDTTGKMGFLNDRSAAWWNLRELLNPARKGGPTICLPDDDRLRGDLCCPRFHTQPGTPKYVLEKKEDIRKRLGRSTDTGDAVVMAFWHTSEIVPEPDTRDLGWKDRPQETSGAIADVALGDDMAVFSWQSGDGDTYGHW